MKLIITDIEDFDISVEGEYKVIKPGGNIRHCIGCFGCWVKTPGKCVIHDGYEGTGIDMGKCSELIIISRCCYGGGSLAMMPKLEPGQGPKAPIDKALETLAVRKWLGNHIDY